MRTVLARIAEDELRHSQVISGITGQEVTASWLKVWFYTLVARVLGITFGVRLMERGEDRAHELYSQLADETPEMTSLAREEYEHEESLIRLIDEERLRYVGAMVLGLNDALMELTGVLSGLTLALQNTRLVGITGLITGLAASLSMSASQYLSTKADTQDQNPVRAAFYTGMAYVVTVVLLVTPYFVASNAFLALGWTLANALLIIMGFTFYTSVARNTQFLPRFVEMVLVSMGVAALSFAIGYLVRHYFGIDV